MDQLIAWLINNSRSFFNEIYSLETVSMALQYTILCIVYFQDAQDEINIE